MGLFDLNVVFNIRCYKSNIFFRVSQIKKLHFYTLYLSKKKNTGIKDLNY